jgi:predicted ester cyclase
MARFGKEVLNEKNLSVVDEIAAEDFVELDPIPGQPPGRDGLKTFLSTVLFPAFPGQAMGDRRASQRRRQGRVTVHFVRHTPRHLHGIPATGRRIAVKGVVIDRVVGGKWKDSRILLDNLGLLQQLGTLPAAAPTPTA